MTHTANAPGSRAGHLPLPPWTLPRTAGVATASGTAAERLSRRDAIFQIPMWVCLKMLCTPLYPMVLLIIIPTKWLFHWEYTLFSDKPMFCSIFCTLWILLADGQLYAITVSDCHPLHFPPRHLRPLRRRGRLRGRLPPLGQGGAPPGRPRGADFGGPAPGG